MKRTMDQVEENGKKAKRPSMQKVVSRQNQSQFGVACRKGSNGTRASLQILLPIRTHPGVTNGKPWLRTTIIGVVRAMNGEGGSSDVIPIPFKMDAEKLEERMSRLKNLLPEEEMKEFPVYEKKSGTILEICTFKGLEEKWIGGLRVGDLISLKDLTYNVSFTRGSQPTIGDDGRLQGVERLEGVPYMSYNAESIIQMHKVKDFGEIKAFLAPLGLGKPNSILAENPFLNERGQFQLPQELIATDEMGMEQIPIFTRFTCEQLDLAYLALYRSNQFGYGVVRNRIVGVPDDEPEEAVLALLEPPGGLPTYYSATIPRKEESDTTDLFVSKKTGGVEKCFRGPKPTKCAILNEYPGNSAGFYPEDDPRRCLAVVAYHQKAGDSCTYVCDIGVNAPLAWERYAPQIFRGLDSVFIVDYAEAASEDFNLSMAPKENGCNIGIMAQIAMIPDFYATFKAAGLRIPRQEAVAVLQAGMLAARVANKVSDILKDQYATAGGNATDYYAQKFLQDRESVSHVFLNAFAGDVDMLPADDDPNWIFVAVPAEGSLTEYQLREKDNSDPIIIRKQRFFERNSSENWREENVKLLEDWKRTPGAYEKLGVFLVKTSFV